MQTTTPTTLYYRQDSSDKVYQAAIEPSRDGYHVTFAYGRRGATLQTGSKTTKPVTLEEAEKIHAKLIASKVSKGYTPAEDGTPYAQTERQGRDSGIRCNDRSDLLKLCAAPAHDEAGERAVTGLTHPRVVRGELTKTAKGFAAVHTEGARIQGGHGRPGGRRRQEPRRRLQRRQGGKGDSRRRQELVVGRQQGQVPGV